MACALSNPAQLREALPVVNWRGTGAIPLATVQAVIKRVQSNPGYTIADTAKLIGQDADWVEDRIKDGTVRPLRTKHDHARLYLSEPMIRRLWAAVITPRVQTEPGAGWLRLGEAALEAGVTTATIIKWAAAGELARTPGPERLALCPRRRASTGPSLLADQPLSPGDAARMAEDGNRDLTADAPMALQDARLRSGLPLIIQTTGAPA